MLRLVLWSTNCGCFNNWQLATALAFFGGLSKINPYQQESAEDGLKL